MMCPVCKTSMIVVEHHRIELDYCPKCQGAWFDSGELELLLESLNLEKAEQFVSDVLNSPAHQVSEDKLRCPICSQRMKKTTTGDSSAIVIDICQNGDGIWFDGGEIAQLTKQLQGKQGVSPSNHVGAFLGEVFKSE